MKKKIFPAVFSLVMILCVLFVVWYLPTVSELRFRLADVQKSLETSQGRERKQQHEYDEAVASIPEIQAELDYVLPLAEDAREEVQTLKEERRRLREQKKELESESAGMMEGGKNNDE